MGYSLETSDLGQFSYGFSQQDLTCFTKLLVGYTDLGLCLNVKCLLKFIYENSDKLLQFLTRNTSSKILDPCKEDFVRCRVIVTC